MEDNVSSMQENKPNAVAHPATVEKGVRKISARTTVKTEETVHHHAQVMNLEKTNRYNNCNSQKVVTLCKIHTKTECIDLQIS